MLVFLIFGIIVTLICVFIVSFSSFSKKNELFAKMKDEDDFKFEELAKNRKPLVFIHNSKCGGDNHMQYGY